MRQGHFGKVSVTTCIFYLFFNRRIFRMWIPTIAIRLRLLQHQNLNKILTICDVLPGRFLTDMACIFLADIFYF